MHTSCTRRPLFTPKAFCLSLILRNSGGRETYWWGSLLKLKCLDRQSHTSGRWRQTKHMAWHSRVGTSSLLEREEEKLLMKEGVCNAFLAMPCIMDCRICSFCYLKDHNSDCVIGNGVHREYLSSVKASSHFSLSVTRHRSVHLKVFTNEHWSGPLLRLSIWYSQANHSRVAIMSNQASWAVLVQCIWLATSWDPAPFWIQHGLLPG